MHLPPVRAAAEGVHDRLDAPEVLLEGLADVTVHGDVPPLFAIGRRQRDVVGRHEPHLDREADHHPAAVDELADGEQCIRHRSPRDRVLHLDEVHEPSCDERAMTGLHVVKAAARGG